MPNARPLRLMVAVLAAPVLLIATIVSTLGLFESSDAYTLDAATSLVVAPMEVSPKFAPLPS